MYSSLDLFLRSWDGYFGVYFLFRELRNNDGKKHSFERINSLLGEYIYYFIFYTT